MAKKTTKPAKAKKAANTGVTHVVFLLDKSGSMANGLDDTIFSFNAYLEGLKDSAEVEVNGNIDFSLVQFDSTSIDKVCTRMPISKVVDLSRSNYRPGAATPLVDASCKSIKAADEMLKKFPGKIVFCIQTDGQENSSSEFTFADLTKLIKARTKQGWQFNFMGAGIDAYDQGAKMGIAAVQTMSYDRNDRDSMRAAMVSNAGNTIAYATGVSNHTAFDNSQRMAAGDEFIPDSLKKKPSSSKKASATASRTKSVEGFTL